MLVGPRPLGVTKESLMLIRALITVCVALVPISIAQTSESSQEPRRSADAAIREVLQRCYVEGMYIKRDPDVLRSGLASTFVMQVYWKGELRTSTASEWLDRMKLSGVPTKKHIESQIKVLDVTGVAAVARVDIHVDSKHKYTDYFGLYKTDEGWKLVTKMFHAH